MTAPLAFQRLTLRAVLRDASPMVIRVVSVPDDTEPTDLHEIFQAILGWNLDLVSCGTLRQMWHFDSTRPYEDTTAPCDDRYRKGP
jgi:hypothetical protein